MGRILFFLAIFCSFLSQSPEVLDAGADGPLKFIWALPFLYQLITSPKVYLGNGLIPIYIFVFLFAFYCFSMQTFTDEKYIADDLYFMTISLLIIMASYNFWMSNRSKNTMYIICLIVLAMGVFLSFDIYQSKFQFGDLSNKQYAYAGKNSLAPILLCSALVLFLMFSPKNKLLFRGSRLIAIISLVVMVMLRSRATLLGAFYVVYYFIFKSSNKKVRIAVLALTLLSVLAILASGGIYDTVVNNIILGARDADDMNDVSSGRLMYFAIALDLIPRHPWIGAGDYYVDCMPLNILTEFGIFGLTIITLFLLYIYKSLSRLDKTNAIYQCAYILYMVFIINALFEARAPFGPGVKSFMLWMFYGFAMAECDTRRAAAEHPANNKENIQKQQGQDT